MILVVCEGNVCRSPVAAALLATALAHVDGGPAVASAGTRALVGSPAEAQTAAVAARHGVDLSSHVARQLDESLAREATLLLAASRSVRSQIVAIHPPSIRSVFTLRQLARVLDADPTTAAVDVDPDERVVQLRERVARRRGMVPAVDPASDDIVDPFRRPTKVHETAAAQAAAAVASLARALGGTPIAWRV